MADPALIIALRKRRMAGMDEEGGGSAPESSGGDMAKYWAMMQDMNGKLDKLISLLAGEEHAPEGQEQPAGKPGY